MNDRVILLSFQATCGLLFGASGLAILLRLAWLAASPRPAGELSGYWIAAAGLVVVLVCLWGAYYFGSMARKTAIDWWWPPLLIVGRVTGKVRVEWGDGVFYFVTIGSEHLSVEPGMYNDFNEGDEVVIRRSQGTGEVVELNRRWFDGAEQLPFLRMIRANPDDPGPLMVYSDWLEEMGRCDEAAAVRAIVAGIQIKDRNATSRPDRL